MSIETREVALVTGASHGIGLEVVSQLGARGMRVFLTARDEVKGQQASDTLAREGLEVVFKRLDVADPKSVTTLAAELQQETEVLDVLVNNAAVFADWTETALSADLAAVEQLLNVNLLGAWRTTQALLPLLERSPHARVVNVTSGAGSFGEPQFGLPAGPISASYGVSKAAANALTVKLAAALVESRILVNAVDPGLTATSPGMEAMGARPIGEGAASVVWAATLPPSGPRGGFFRDGQPLPW